MFGRARTWFAEAGKRREERRHQREAEAARLAAQRAEEARRAEEERLRQERQRRIMNALFRVALVGAVFLLLLGYLRDSDVVMAVGGSILIVWAIGEIVRGFIAFTFLVVIAGLLMILFPPVGLVLGLIFALTPKIDIDIFDIDLFD